MAVRFGASVGLRSLRGPRLGGSLEATTRSARAQFNDVLKNFHAIIREFQTVTPEALESVLQPIFDRSQELVPVDTGALKDSGYLEIRIAGNKINAEVGYGRGGVPIYSVFVHENLEMFHEPPTQAKFLQTAIEEHLDSIRPTLLAFYTRGWGPGL